VTVGVVEVGGVSQPGADAELYSVRVGWLGVVTGRLGLSSLYKTCNSIGLAYATGCTIRRVLTLNLFRYRICSN